MIDLDFISVVIGYIVGVCLTWSLTFTLFGCENCDTQDKYPKKVLDQNEWHNTSYSVYNWNYPYDRDTRP